MATTPQALPFRPEVERASHRRLDQFHSILTRVAQRADEAHRQGVHSGAKVQDMEGNPPVEATQSAGHRIMACLAPFMLAGACFGDWVISVPTAEWITLSVLGQPDWLPWTRIAFPLGIILIDGLASFLRYREQEEALLQPSRDGRHLLPWALLAALMLLSLATQLALQPPPGASPQFVSSFWTKAAGLVLLSAVLHGLIILNGQLIVESLSYLWFLGHRAWLRRTVRHAEAAQSQHALQAVLYFGHYLRERDQVSERFGRQVSHPFDEVTRRVLRERLGYDPIAGQDGGSAGSPSSPSGPQPPAGPVDDNHDPKIPDHHLRDEESEVRN